MSTHILYLRDKIFSARVAPIVPTFEGTERMEEPKLRAKVLELLGNRPRNMTYKDIADATDLPEPWLKTFAAGRIADPSVNRVETLYNFLTGKPLNV